MDRVLGLTAAVAGRLRDGRQRGKVRHGIQDMLRQRVYGLALGYEDLNDHAALRHDLVLQTATDRDRPLASPPTLCRFENAAERAWATLALLVKRLRRVWPGVRIIFRGDGDFCRPRMLTWCERVGVGYIVGRAKNAGLNALSQPWLEDAERRYEATGEKQRLYAELRYAARTWDRERRVIARIEHGPKGSNPRYVVTNLAGDGRVLYEKLHCGRGEMENRIKEQQLDLFAERTSCHRWWPNHFRLLLASLAYTLMEAVRRQGLKGTEMARAQARTIRLRLLKISAVIVRNSRRVRVMLSSACPDRELFCLVAARLAPG